MTITIPSLSQLPEAAARFADALGNRRVIAFHAQMGAGKTTFISALCEHYGVEPDQVNSPTFAIVNDYPSPQGSIYHFDLYRLKDFEELLDMGAEDYFYSGHLCLIEWPDLAVDILPEDTLHVNISVDAESGERIISFSDENN